MDNIFDDDDADHDCQAVKMSSQNTAMEVKKSGGSKDILVDLHRMFPTPPSVEQVRMYIRMYYILTAVDYSKYLSTGWG